MKHLVGPELRREVDEFRLEFTCESCAHFDEPGERCGNGYPVAPHRRADLAVESSVTFCKEFELA